MVCPFFLLVKVGKAVEKDKAGCIHLRHSWHSFLFSNFQVVTEFGDQRLRMHRRPALPYDEATARVKERRWHESARVRAYLHDQPSRLQ